MTSSTPPRRPSSPGGRRSEPPTPRSTRPSRAPQRGSEPPSRSTRPGRRSSSHSLRQGGRAIHDDAERAERRRAATVQLVSAIYRLVKACQLYDDANQTVQLAVVGASEALGAFFAVFDTESVRILFSADTVFVDRRLLRAPRESYALALQLGALLGQADLNELTLDRRVEQPILLRLARILVDAARSPAAAAPLHADDLPGVTGRSAALPDDWAAEQRETPVARVVKAYASAGLVLKAYHARLLAGDLHGAHEIKRVAQKLVAMAERYPELLVAVASTPLPSDDPLRAATSTAVLALSMARKLTDDRGLLTTITHAALLADVGRRRLEEPDAGDRLAPSSLIALAKLGQFHEGTMRRAVVTYEALQQEQPSPANAEGCEMPPEAELAAADRPTVAAVLLRVARRFNALRAPRPAGRPHGIDEALRQLDAMAASPIEIAAVRLLVASLGFFPEGTLVELTSGEVAMVTGTPAVALDFARPPVRVLTDAEHRALVEPLAIDLARPGPGQRPRSIRQALVGAGRAAS